MSKIKFEIKNRWTGSILFEHEKENNTLIETVEKAVEEGAYLSGANLRGAYLKGANLRDANLEEADLRGAYLKGANLRDANLEGTNLVGAYIYFDDNEIDSEKIIKDFEERNNIKIIETYTNKNVIPTRWNCFWEYGLTIDKWKIKEKEEIIKENKEIEELNDTNYVESEMSCEDANYYHNLTRNKLNEVIRAVNKLTKESEEK